MGVDGQIVKALSGFYYVKTDVSRRVYMCRARGKFKNEGISPLVGDFVRIEIQDEEEGVVDEILPRRNSFIRPPVANIDAFLLIMAVHNPAPNSEVLDKLLVNAEAARAGAIICMNKADGEEEELEARKFAKVYEGIYPILYVSAISGKGVAAVREAILGKTVALAGPSGVGKTSLVSALTDDWALETGELSRKTGRGKHTTRSVEIYEIGDGSAKGIPQQTKLMDTPGFTSFEVDIDEDERLDMLFPDFVPYLGNCRFDNCTHENEPECAVLEALSKRKISQGRYNTYLKLLAAERGESDRPEYVKGHKKNG
ncbi:MAG: ribosome small subunit-dependent GTPase A [Clostridiales Family XIII bacterium]|jgi:ribosome biogenesis GTPase|nr:ribosome small subunit-dependent GTPase A [Clostridiales Family XIII bacterium]